MYICTVTIGLVFNILLFFFLSTPHSLFFSLVWLSPHALFSSTDLRCSLKSRHSCATTDHLTRRCSCRSLLLTSITTAFIDRRCYLFSLFDGFGILISGFWWFATPLLSQVSPQPCHRRSSHSALLTPITATLPIAVAFTDAIFFLCLMVLGFWSVGFDGPLLRYSLESCHSRAIVDHLTRHCSCWSPLPCQSSLLSPIAIAIFFLCLMVLGFWSMDFDGFDQWFWWFWLVGFDDFD